MATGEGQLSDLGRDPGGQLRHEVAVKRKHARLFDEAKQGDKGGL